MNLMIKSHNFHLIYQIIMFWYFMMVGWIKISFIWFFISSLQFYDMILRWMSYNLIWFMIFINQFNWDFIFNLISCHFLCLIGLTCIFLGWIGDDPDLITKWNEISCGREKKKLRTLERKLSLSEESISIQTANAKAQLIGISQTGPLDSLKEKVNSSNINSRDEVWW